MTKTRYIVIPEIETVVITVLNKLSKQMLKKYFLINYCTVKRCIAIKGDYFK